MSERKPARPHLPIEPPEKEKLVQEGKRGVFHVVFGRTMVVLVLLAAQFAILFMLLFHFAQYVPYYVGGSVVVTAVMLIFVLNTRDNPAIKLSWSILIAVMPVFGAMLYLFIRNDLGHRLEQQVLHDTLVESGVYVSDQSALMERIREEDRGLYNLASYTLKNAGCPVYGNTEVQYFPLGENKFEAMLTELEQAKEFIFLEYFILERSYMWSRVLEVLERKVREGVEVRVMYDGTCAVTLLPYGYPKELEKRGIRCKMFSPIRPFVSTHYNNRDHRKILVIDGVVAFTGGVNIADEYINRKEVHGHWKDTAVMVRGDAARSFTLMFLQIWNYSEHERVYEPYLKPAGTLRTEAEGYVIPYGDSPLDDENVGEMVYLDILNRAKDYVYIMTPYLILDHEMVTALRFAAKRGVDVRLILPHIPDKQYAFMLAKSHYRELTEAGVRIYEYTPGFVHAKVFLSDDRQAVVGTINLDYRSLYLHFECAAYLYKVPAIADIRADFLSTLDRSQEVTAEEAKRQGLFTRLCGWLLKVAAPLM
ncbi:MAG: cardiolipin synthase [Oscillospiraceae bacterium]